MRCLLTISPIQRAVGRPLANAICAATAGHLRFYLLEISPRAEFFMHSERLLPLLPPGAREPECQGVK